MNGLCVHGTFISSETREYNDKQYLSVMVACGSSAYSIGMQLDELNAVRALSLGDDVIIKCVPFVNRQGRVAFYRGQVMSDS